MKTQLHEIFLSFLKPNNQLNCLIDRSTKEGETHKSFSEKSATR